MILSHELENDIKEAVKVIKEKHRINGTVLIVLNNDTTHIVSKTKREGSKYMFGYGIGYSAGHNDLYDSIYNKKHFNLGKSTNKTKEYQ